MKTVQHCCWHAAVLAHHRERPLVDWARPGRADQDSGLERRDWHDQQHWNMRGLRRTGLAGFARLAEGASGSGWALAARFWP